MKLTLGLLNAQWDVVSMTTLQVEDTGTGNFGLNDVPVDFEPGFRRFVFLQIEPAYGKVSFSIRRQPLLGLTEFYGRLVEVEFFASLRRMPFVFTGRIDEQRFLKVMLEGELARQP